MGKTDLKIQNNVLFLTQNYFNQVWWQIFNILFIFLIFYFFLFMFLNNKRVILIQNQSGNQLKFWICVRKTYYCGVKSVQFCGINLDIITIYHILTMLNYAENYTLTWSRKIINNNQTNANFSYLICLFFGGKIWIKKTIGKWQLSQFFRFIV